MNFFLKVYFVPLWVAMLAVTFWTDLSYCGAPAAVEHGEEDGAAAGVEERARADTPAGAVGAPAQPAQSASPGVQASTLAATYPWLAGAESGARELAKLTVIALDERFAPPAGFTRVKLKAGSFGAFLRTLPLRTDRKAVRSYLGTTLQSPSAAVVALDVGERNLQQCADTIIRLHAEYLWGSKQHARLSYHFTSGDRTRWSEWKQGERFKVSGSSVERVRRGKTDGSRRAFRDWLDTVFMYAGTRSLRLDSTRIKAQELRPGDFFVTPGSPGHAIIVLDVAIHADGRRVGLLGQGYMPAQELHVLRAEYAGVIDKVWFVLPDADESLRTPSWKPFPADQIRRFNTK